MATSRSTAAVGSRRSRGVVRADHGPHRAEAGHRVLLGLVVGQPGGQALGHRLAQVVLGLGEHPAGLPGPGAQGDVELVQVVLDQVAAGGAHADHPSTETGSRG